MENASIRGSKHDLGKVELSYLIDTSVSGESLL